MARKIVFVIVEGPSDDAALNLLFNKLYDKNLVRIEIFHGDITTKDRAGAENIVGRIGDLVKHYAAANHFTRQNFQEVIHIVDTDGAFIPESAVVEDITCNAPVYSLTDIRTARPSMIRQRNREKRDVLSRLISLKKVWGSIPYSVFYMSSNLDHVLYDKLNSTDDEKESDAYAFAKRYQNDLSGFLSFICDSTFSFNGDYKSSWEFIQQDLHSLERHSNLGLLFEQFKSSRDS